MYSAHFLKSDFGLTIGKLTQMTKENSKEMKDLSASNVSHVSRKSLQCMHITIPYAGHVVEVTFRNHNNACDVFSNRTRLSFSLLMLYSEDISNLKNLSNRTKAYCLIVCQTEVLFWDTLYMIYLVDFVTLALKKRHWRPFPKYLQIPITIVLQRMQA